MKKALFNSRGINLLELMLALGLSSGLVLMDLEIRKNDLIARRRQKAEESIGGLESSLRSFFSSSDTIEDSFGVGSAADKRATLATGGQNTIATREASVDRTDPDIFTITVISISEGTTTTPAIVQSTVGGVDLMGEPSSGTIKSIDGRGNVYIRTMWMSDFQETDPDPISIVGPTVTVELRQGNATLNVLLWFFPNLKENPGLNCIANNNCERRLLRIPLLVRVVNNGTANTLIYDGSSLKMGGGSQRLECDSEITIALDISIANPPCPRPERQFFNATGPIIQAANCPTGILGADGVTDTLVGCNTGRCCWLAE